MLTFHRALKTIFITFLLPSQSDAATSLTNFIAIIHFIWVLTIEQTLLSIIQKDISSYGIYLEVDILTSCCKVSLVT